MTYPHPPIEAPAKTQRVSQGKDGRVTLIVSSSVLAALSGGLGAFGAARIGGDVETREQLLAARVEAKILAEIDNKYLSKPLFDARLQRLEDQLAAIRADLARLTQLEQRR